MGSSILTRIVEAFLFFVLSVSAGFYIGWTVHGWEYNSQYKDAFTAQTKNVQAQLLANQALSDKYQQQIIESKKMAESINERVKTEIVEKPIYVECHVPASGMQLLNQTVDSINTTRAP